MRYDNTSVRRQDRLLDEARALQILHEGEYGFLALVETRADAVAGYGIPSATSSNPPPTASTCTAAPRATSSAASTSVH